MNPLPFILLAISLPLLLGGCGEKPVAEVKPVEEKVLEVEEEVKPELEGIGLEELRASDEGISYFKDAPYTGKVFNLWPNGQKWIETNYKDGKRDGLDLFWYTNGQKQQEVKYKNGEMDGLQLFWHDNGQKQREVNYKDGVEISAKFWNNKGELISETFSTPKD